jgi:hypothetical protein
LLGARRVAGPHTVHVALGGLTRAAPAPALPPTPTSGLPAPGPARDGDAVRRSVTLAARAAARQSATCGTVRRPIGQQPELRRPRLAAAAGGGVGGGPPIPARRSCGRGTAPGPQLRWRGFSAWAGTAGARPAAPSGRTASGGGCGGDGVDRRRSRRAAVLRPLAASQFAAAPPGLSPMDTQLCTPICASWQTQSGCLYLSS